MIPHLYCRLMIIVAQTAHLRLINEVARTCPTQEAAFAFHEQLFLSGFERVLFVSAPIHVFPDLRLQELTSPVPPSRYPADLAPRLVGILPIPAPRDEPVHLARAVGAVQPRTADPRVPRSEVPPPRGADGVARSREAESPDEVGRAAARSRFLTETRARVPIHLSHYPFFLSLFRPYLHADLVPVFPLVDTDDVSPFACRNCSSFPAASSLFPVSSTLPCTVHILTIRCWLEKGREIRVVASWTAAAAERARARVEFRPLLDSTSCALFRAV